MNQYIVINVFLMVSSSYLNLQIKMYKMLILRTYSI